MACKYYLNGEYSKLYTELYNYFDNTAPETKSANAVYKILKSNRLVTIRDKTMFLNQSNVPRALREIKRINNKYPGLLSTEYKGMSNDYWHSPSAPIHIFTINETILKEIPAVGDTNAAISSNNQVDIDQYVSFVAGSDPNLRDYYLDELARRENRSESRFSDVERESLDNAYRIANRLKNSFAAAGVTVEVVFDSGIDNIGQVDPTIEGNPTIRINPNKVRKDTTFHEFGHIYIDLLGVNHPVVKAAIEQLKDTDLYKRVQENYPELYGDLLDKEVLATAIGLEGAKIVRKNPNKLQTILNRLFRAIGKLFGITPNQAAILAEEMFAGELRAEALINPLSSFMQASKEDKRLTELVQDARILVRNDLNKLKKLPEDQKSKEDEIALLNLEASLTRIQKVEDFIQLVTVMGETLATARAQYNQILEVSEEERGTNENINKMYQIQQKVDRLELFQDIKTLVLSTKRRRNIKDYEAFDTLEDKLNAVLDEIDMLSEDFQETIIPMLAQSLMQFTSKDINPQLQALIDNIKNSGREWSRWIDDTDPRYTKLKKRQKEGKITNEEFAQKRDALTIEQLKEKKINNYKGLVVELTKAHTDKSYYSLYIDPTIYSSDRGIQLLVKAILNANIEKNDMTLDFKSKIAPVYTAFAEGQNEANVEKLNDPLLEEITVLGKKRLALVNPIDTEKYYAAQKNKRMELYEKYKRPKIAEYEKKGIIDEYFRDLNSWERNDRLGGRFNQEMNTWNDNNTKEVKGWQKELKALKEALKIQTDILKSFGPDTKVQGYTNALINKNQLEKELARNYPLGKPAGDWVQPDPVKYLNPKYTAIQEDARLKTYYDFIVQEYAKAQKMIGKQRSPDKNDWDKFSYIMPSYRKEGYDRLREKGAWNTAKDIVSDAFTIQETNHDFESYNEDVKDRDKIVPIYATNRVDAKEVSKDIATSIYRFRDMTHNYRTKNDILGQVMFFKQLIENREYLETSAGGKQIINSIAKSLGFEKFKMKEGESNASKQLNEFIDMVFFGQYNLKKELNIAGKTISLNQAASSLMAFTAYSTLSFNFLQAGNQSILDNMTMFQEAFAGQFFSIKDMGWAKSQYWLNSAAIMDISNFNPKTKLGKALEYFDALTEFTDQEGSRVVGGNARKLTQSKNYMFAQQTAEHELSATRMLALMKSLEGKLKDKDGNVIMNEEGNPANLYDLLVVDDKGKMSVDPRVANFSRLDFIAKLQGISRRTNQIKGQLHQNVLSKSWYGKLFMMFRKWLPPGIRRRYGHRGGFVEGSSVHIDEELGAVTEGMYISFARFLAESVSNKDMRLYSKLSRMEQENVKRTSMELATIFAAGALVMLLIDLDDDEDNWVNNYMLYQAKRYQTEMLQWQPWFAWKESLRILQSPTATVRPVTKGVELISQMFSEIQYLMGSPFVDESAIFYQRRSGRFKKGDRKIRKDFEDLLPIFRGLQKTFNPSEAYKWFTTLN
jgi:hypothetical protein